MRARQRRKEVLFSDGEPVMIVGEWDGIERIVGLAEQYGFEQLERLQAHMCVRKFNFSDLFLELDRAAKNDQARVFTSYLEEVKSAAEKAENCVCLRYCEHDLLDLFESVIGRYQEEGGKEPEGRYSIPRIIERFFTDFDYHEFSVCHLDDPSTIANALRGEVVEYYGADCWDQAEMEINQITPSKRMQLDFSDLVEILHGICLECA